jgi:hypothetical protein
MAYEFSTPRGVLHLLCIQRRWTVQLNGRQRGRWLTPDAAAAAVARHKSGLPDWDRHFTEAPDDLLDWRPLGDSL